MILMHVCVQYKGNYMHALDGDECICGYRMRIEHEQMMVKVRVVLPREKKEKH